MWYGSWLNPKNLAGCRTGPRTELSDRRRTMTDCSTTTGSFPLSDSGALVALRYAQRARTGILQMGNALDAAGLR